MKKVSNINLKNNAALYAVGYNEASPLENHKGGEIGHNTDKTEFYIHEVVLVTYGTQSVEKAINSIL